MTVHISNAAAILACKTINDLINADATAPAGGFLRIYSGTRPVNADTPPTGGNTLLIEFALPNPVFQNPTIVGANATATVNTDGVDPVTAAAPGTATWFLIADGDGTTVLDGSVTDTTGAGDLKLSTVTIVAGIDVSVVSLTASMPTGV